MAQRREGAQTSESDARTTAAFSALVERMDRDVFEAPGDAVIRLQTDEGTKCDVHITAAGADLRPAADRGRHPDSALTASAATWLKLVDDVRSGMRAFQSGDLRVRGNLHVGIGFLAATSNDSGSGRLRFRQLQTAEGTVSVVIAGTGSPVLMAHGLGATKASFLPTVAALAGTHQCVAMDLPGFGDSDKPLFAGYDAPFFSRWMAATLDALSIDRAGVIGHSLGGRAAIELALSEPQRVDHLVLLCPSLAWRRSRDWAGLLRFVRPELGVLQIAPRGMVERVLDRILPAAASGWAAAGKDEFLRAYLTPAGRAAFYAAARQIYLEEPEGAGGFWPRLAELRTPSLWIWGRRDGLVPAAFRRHVRDVVPNSRHVLIDGGHVLQLERPKQTHAAIREFIG